MTNGETKELIEKCVGFDGIDAILTQTYCKTYTDKFNYLKMLFNISDTADYDSTPEYNYKKLVGYILDHYCNQS